MVKLEIGVERLLQRRLCDWFLKGNARAGRHSLPQVFLISCCKNNTDAVACLPQAACELKGRSWAPF